MNGTTDSDKVFDLPHAVSISRARKEFVENFLPQLIQENELKTAIDVGCGFGYFTRYLKDLGLEVSAVDGRSENVDEAKKRNPDVQFEVHNIESPSVAKLGSFDLVICFGLLYHLENPFCAIRNLSSLTRKVCLIETMISPFSSPLTTLIEEGKGRDQGLNYIAQVPTESWFLKVLSEAGFPFIYKTNSLPRHPEFSSSLFRRQCRTFLVAAKESLSHPILKIADSPLKTNRFMWYPYGIRHLLGHERIINFLKIGRRLFRGGQ